MIEPCASSPDVTAVLAAGDDYPAVFDILQTFDRLMRDMAGTQELTKTAAQLAGCPACVADNAGRTMARYDDSGRQLPAGRPGHAEGEAYGEHHLSRGHAWLEPDGSLAPLQRLVLNRLAFALSCQVRGASAMQEVRRAKAIETVLCERNESTRSAAALLLNLHPEDHVHVIVAAGRDEEYPIDAVTGPTSVDRGWPLRTAVIDRCLHIVALTTELNDVVDSLTSEVSLGVGPARRVCRAPESLAGAVVALRFAGRVIGPRCVRFDELGPLRVLANISSQALLEIGDVRALDRLATSPHGLEGIRSFEAFLRLGSLRPAAQELYLHHSGVAVRVDRVFSALELDREVPLHRLRGHLAVMMWNAAHSGDPCPAELGSRPGGGGEGERESSPR